MKNYEYDFDKETDKDFLREAGKMLLKRVVHLQLEVNQLSLAKKLDEEIKAKLTGELLVLRKKFFDSKQEALNKNKKNKKKHKKKKSNLLHNKNENKDEVEDSNPSEINLESEEITYDIEDSHCPECPHTPLEELKDLFQESTEIDVVTSYFILKRHKRKKYKCPHCLKMLTAKGPEKIVDGGKFSAQMACKVICDKFQYHLPLERQRSIMKDAGLNVSVKTLYCLTDYVYQLLLSLGPAHIQDLFSGFYVSMDESPLAFFNPQKSKGYAWTLSNQIGAYYQFEATRSGEVAKEMLKGFKGIVMTDGYGGYGHLDNKDGIIHAYCWSHLRRYFFEALLENEKAGEVVELVDQFYKIEHEAKDYAELKELRSTKSQEFYDKIVNWMSENEGRHLKTSLTGKAINYFYNQQKGLAKFLTNEKIPMDNNGAERRQRCPVLGGKNYLAFRSINGADVAMFFYSIIESCKTNGLNPNAYLLEMTLRAIKKENLETPYRYACRVKNEIQKSVTASLGET